MWAKQSTAATLIVGPILDSAGAEYTGAVIGDLSISKNGGTLTALAAAATLTHIANGQYTLVTTTGNLDTLGRAQITCNKSTYQMPEVRLMVVPAMVFDSIVAGSDRLDVNVTHVADTSQTAGDIAALLATLSGYVDTEVAAIKAKTDNLPSDPADASDIAAAFSTVNSTLSTIAAYIDTEVAAIKAKTDNLPSDPADASDIAASFSSLASTLSTISSYIDTEIAAIKTKTDQLTFTTANKVDSTAVLDSAARVKLDTIQPDYVPATATSLAAAKAILDKIDSGLVADGLVYQFTANMLELGPSGGGGSSDWTADERTAIRSILGIPGSGTTPADPTVGVLDTIRDLVVAYIAAALATVNGTSGTIVGFPTSLNIGDSYTDEANSSIHVFIRDASDDPITAVGDFLFTDPEFAPEVNITQSGSTGRVKAIVTYVDPGAPESYLKVEIPSSQSRRASPGTATIQCLLKWVDTDGKVLAQKTLSKQAVTWNEMV